MKINFRIKGLIIFIILLPLLYFLFGLVIYYAIKARQFLPIFISLLIMILPTIGFVFGFMHGIKFNEKTIRIISQQRIKRFKIEDVKTIEVKFLKKKKYYKVVAIVFVYKGNSPIQFVWDSISSYRGPSINYNITDKNINQFIEKLSMFDYIKIKVEKESLYD